MSKLHLEPQVLLLMMGHPAAGKSTMSKRISDKVHITHIDNNDIRESMIGGDRESELYKKRLGPGSYEAMYSIAITNLQARNSVNIEVPHMGLTYGPSEQRFRVSHIADQTDSDLKIVFTQFREQDFDTLKSRMEQRMIQEGTTRDQDKLDDWDNYVKRAILRFNPKDLYFTNSLLLNAVDGTEDNLEKILNYLVSDNSCKLTDTDVDMRAQITRYCEDYLNRPELVPYMTANL